MLNVKNTVNWFHLCTLPILLISPTLSHADSTTVAFKAWSRYLQNGKDVVKTVDVKWPAEKTAVVICDMWSSHWCDSASRRCAEMAPRINAFVSALRSRSVLIIHCPSSGVKHYGNTPMRMRAKAAPVVKTEVPLLAWCSIDKTREQALPIDDSDNGCDCQPRCPTGGGRMELRQIAAIKMADEDAVTDSPEAY